jgi:adenine deaminase
MIAALAPWRDRILGLGLGGPEIGHPPSKFRRAFAAARGDYGWGTVAHAGEEGGAEYVRDALDTLEVDRIDHGVRCDADPDLVARLADDRTPLTVCPCSNIMLHVFPEMKSHNIRKLHEAGLCITVNSDDPPYFGGYINENYAAIQAGLGLGDEDLWQMARNSFTSAFMGQELRSRYLSELDGYRPKVDRK